MRYVIFGSGGMAKELIGYGMEVAYVVSTEPLDNPDYEVEVLKKALPGNERFLLAVADPVIKKKIVMENDDRWSTFIHPSCYISPYAKIGKGCIFAPQAIVAGDPVIGDFVFFNTNATVGHDTTIGDYSTLFPNSEICGNCSIGDSCLFGIGSYVLPKCHIPSGSKVSAGAIVRKSLDSACTVYGDPAKPRAA